MNRPFRHLLLPALSAALALAVRLSGADAPTSAPTAATPSPAAGAPAVVTQPTPTPRVAPLVLPKPLEGVITQEEFETYVKFQKQVREDPDMKALNDQILAKRKEMVELQKKAQAAVQAMIEANPEIKAIADKIKAHNSRPMPALAPRPVVVPAQQVPAPATPTPASK
jgi:hypothetical protein